ncbi:aminotransferase class V-fold PLP-dependent enzyme [Caldisphaera sp.]|uniref:aminotransferase class V-fold PLP-dependent enzyme n=1 Tax=Caldisphaera sp. TaxID=2060322 RepID=UPI0025BDA221|nr:aminotransferase class V-fold PLP-dependent enzyme [Caldisphaera sp.]
MKNEFEVFNKYTYLNWASVGDPPYRSIKAMEDYLENLKSTPDELTTSNYYGSIIDDIKNNLGKLINGKKENIALIGNSTTPAIQTAMNSINLQKGDEMIVFDLDFPTVYSESLKWKEKGVKIKVIRNKKGDYNIDDILHEINKETKVILTSSVFWVNGLMLDIKEMADAIHENDGFLVIDAIQHIGQSIFDASKNKADFVAFGTQKWLLSPFSVGVLYISDRALKLTNPPNYGYLNLDVGMSWDEFWGYANKSPANEYKLKREGAKSYETGGFFSIPSLIGLRESLKLINDIGIENINTHILKLRRILVEHLIENGIEIVSPLDDKKASGILTFKLYPNIYDNYKVVDELYRKFFIKVSGRASAGIGGIRVSIHFPNEENDVYKLIQALKSIKT